MGKGICNEWGKGYTTNGEGYATNGGRDRVEVFVAVATHSGMPHVMRRLAANANTCQPHPTATSYTLTSMSGISKDAA